MSLVSLAGRLLAQEARALLSRLDRVKPFALQETMVAAAAPSVAAQGAIDRYLIRGRRQLRDQVRRYLRWLESTEGAQARPAEMQRRFAFLRMRFNAVLGQLDIFADALTQRSEHESGVWLAGLDAVATDALALPGNYFDPPAVICYLDRGAGAAIRRARTRLPGGGMNPVAIIRVPRERMVGGGIASSLIHEVGHQGSELLGLEVSLRPTLYGMQRNAGPQRAAWFLWTRWLAESLADFWATARLGVAATLGLMGVVSLPRIFVFRLNADDPHAVPWLRVKLSCALGQALYPHPQWAKLSALWEALYPMPAMDPRTAQLFALLQSTMPGFVALIANHRPKALRGKTLAEVMRSDDRQPARLAAYLQTWRRSPALMLVAAPSLAFAVIAQARADGEVTERWESDTIARLLTHWALRQAHGASALCPSCRSSHFRKAA